jgi:hypothetical protein
MSGGFVLQFFAATIKFFTELYGLNVPPILQDIIEQFFGDTTIFM